MDFIELPLIVSPCTGSNLLRIRRDSFGSGDYGSERKRSDGTKYTNNGIDIICEPGQKLFAPITAIFERIEYPYASGKEYAGALFRGKEAVIKVFYFSPSIKVGSEVKQGQNIGYAQDISLRYNKIDTPLEKEMIPHISLQVEWISDKLRSYLASRYSGFDFSGRINPMILL